MVSKFSKIAILLLAGTFFGFQATAEEYVSQSVEASACDDRQANDDKQTAENRAIDKACMSAVKLSGILQRNYPDLSEHAGDLITYRIIDENLKDVEHQVTLENESRVCVRIKGVVQISADELAQLVEEYKQSDAPQDAQIIEAVEEIKAKMAIKPQNPDEQKLIYISEMNFWNGTETSHYSEYLTGLMAQSDYFYVTDKMDLADYILLPRLIQAEVDEIDSQNHKMKMIVELEIIARRDDDFLPLNERQNHFILFAASKNEQEVADTLIRKLLSRAATALMQKMDKYIENSIENKIRNTK